MDLDMQTRRRLAALDTSEISDALDSLEITGGLIGLGSRVPGMKMVGPAFTIEYAPMSDRRAGSFHGAPNYIDSVPEGHVIVIAGGSDRWTNWGDILTEVASRRGLGGTVIDGSIRDVETLQSLGYPLFSRSVFMVSGKNRSTVVSRQETVRCGGVSITPGDWIVGDGNGVVAIPHAALSATLERAERIAATETRIRDSVRAGLDLAEARALHRYDQPWLAVEATAERAGVERAAV